MKDPKISLNKLGEYLNATPARRRRIVEDQINPQDFIATRYSDARESISSFIAGQINEQELLDIAESLKSAAYESKFTTQDKNLSAEAMEEFVNISDQLPTGYILEKVPANDASKLNISGVSVSVRPDVYVKSDSNEVVGAIKLHFPKSNPLSTSSGEYIATALKTFLQENHQGPIDHKLCVVVDIPTLSVIAAPKAGKKRMNDIEAACEEINARWKLKDNTPDNEF